MGKMKRGKQGLLVVISGPSSGAGKDAVARGVEKRQRLTRIVTYNSRDKRPGEVEGVDYHFVSREEFLKKEKQGFFLEKNEYNRNLYGTPKEEVLEALKRGEDVLLRIDVNGAREVKRQMPEAVTIFIYATITEMGGRLMRRGRDSEEEMERKMVLARKEMLEKDKGYFDYQVYNQDGKLNEAIEEVLGIIVKEKAATAKGAKN